MKGEHARHGKAAHNPPPEAHEIFDTVCHALREGLFAEAIDALESLLEKDVEYPGAASTLKCAGFWREQQDGDPRGPHDPEDHGGNGTLEGFERGEQLLGQWRLFQAFAERLADTPERCLFAIKQFVFSSALSSYGDAGGGPGAGSGGSAGSVGSGPADAETGEDPYLLLQIGRCHKGLGNYERAIECLERANRQAREDARVLAELADCYSLVNESRAAKVFFREAFYVDPQAIDLAGLESPLVHRLAGRLREKGFVEPLLNEWLPVYGAVWGVFNVKREMKPLEFGKLKQAIYRLERERRVAGPEGERAVPRLINRYFWLIDHYLTTGEPRERVEEVLQKLKETDPGVHEAYTT
jgi:tetratricopeptide (TPR) repeat protein